MWFAGNHSGLYVTPDAGRTWWPLRGGLPTVPIHDMVIQPREHDLVVASHGRGFWILDSLAGLEGLTPQVIDDDAALFTPRPATILTR